MIIDYSSLIRVGLRFGALISNAALFGIVARYFTPLEMGIWALASTMTSIVMSMDLGVANFVRNQLAIFEERKEEYFFSGITIALVLASIYSIVALFAFIMPPGFIGSEGRLRETVPYLGLAILLLAIRLPCAVATNAFYSYGEANLFNWFEFASLFVSVLATLLCLTFAGRLVFALATFYFTGSVVSVTALYVFLWRRGWHFEFNKIKRGIRIIRGGLPFGVLQIVGLGLNSLPAFVVGALISVEEVTLVRAAMIIGQTVLALHLAHAMPLWTEFSRITPQNINGQTIRNLKSRLANESILLGIVLVVLSVVSPKIIDLWIGRPVASFPLTVVFMLWAWGYGICNIYSMVLNGRGRPLATAVALVPGIVIAIGLAPLLSGQWGSIGIGLAFTIGAGISAILMVNFAISEFHHFIDE